jgi:hypothetical protein
MKGNHMTRFEEMLSYYVDYLQRINNEYYDEHLTNLSHPVVKIDSKGRKYKRIVIEDHHNGEDDPVSRYVHSFVEIETGNVFKPAGWKGPEKNHVRANIYNYESIKNGVNRISTNYIR